MPISIYEKIKKRIYKIWGIRYFYLKGLFKKAFFVLKKERLGKFLVYFYKYALYGREYFKYKTTDDSYNSWIHQNENWDIKKIRKEIEEFSYMPKISIITPVYNVDPEWLEKCIESVTRQFYENWELCLYDDASTKKETLECLKKWENTNARIKISYGRENQHISGASNEAINLATGEFIALLDNDDELSSNALYEVVKLLNHHQEADFIYSDEDKIDVDGKRDEPFFKPDYSPDLLLSMNYITHLCVFRSSIINEIGGFRKGYEGSQDYDLILRFIEQTDAKNIFHISKILYHWRKIPQSTAGGANSKSYAYDVAKKTLADYLKRNSIEGEVLHTDFFGLYRIKRRINTEKKVSIIIPFKDQASILKKCIKSISNKTNYNNYEIILVNNQSLEGATLNYLKSLKNSSFIKIINYDKPFNFSAINNYAVKMAQGDYILFLNNDIEVISQEWLSAMVEQIQRDEVGIVGAKLLYPDNTIQHAGVIMGLGIASHAFKHLPAGRYGYFGLMNVIRNYSAVTAACFLTKKNLFNRVRGFDEVNLKVAFNDVDFCLKVRESGHLITYTPYAELYHHESLSRGDDNELERTNPEKFKRVLAEREFMRKKWSKFIENDPYYNPNLTRGREDFSIRL